MLFLFSLPIFLYVTVNGTGENTVRCPERFLRKTYLKDNLVMRYGLQPGSEERVAGARIYGASSHGVALGIVLNDEAYLFKTFITTQ